MPLKRKSLSQRTRFEIFKRDGFACQYCGRTPPSVILHVDHILAVASGGDGSETNLITSCAECNQGKSSVSLDRIPSALHDQIKIQKEQAAQIKAYNGFLMKLYLDKQKIMEQLGLHWYDKFVMNKGTCVFGSSRQDSIRTFLKHLTATEILESMDIAQCRVPVRRHQPTRSSGTDEPSWKYFCGVCWKKIKGRSNENQTN